jgi:hypothetical protein
MKTTTFTDQANDLIALSNNEIDKSRGSGIKKLKPGETKPSHRKEAASTWSTS